MNRFPVCIDIENKKILIVGAGSIAARKASSVRRFTKHIKVIDRERGIEDFECVRKEFEPADLDGADIVITATGSAEEDGRVVAACRERKIPVNAADDREECDFFLPATIKRGKLVVSISTQGASPAYSRRLREQIEEIIPEDIEEVLDEMCALRESLPGRVSNGSVRARIYSRALDALLEGGRELYEDSIEKIIKECEDEKTDLSEQGK